MVEYKSTSSKESSPEENIESQKGWLEITKKECLFGCIGLPVFLAIIISNNCSLFRFHFMGSY